MKINLQALRRDREPMFQTLVLGYWHQMGLPGVLAKSHPRAVKTLCIQCLTREIEWGKQFASGHLACS